MVLASHGMDCTFPIDKLLRMSYSFPPLCSHCNVILSIDPIQVHCVCYRESRRLVIAYCRILTVWFAASRSMRGMSYGVVLGAVVFIVILAIYKYYESDTSSSFFATETRQSDCAPQFNITQNDTYGNNYYTPRCYIPGLQDINQYWAYLHNTEMTCNDMRQFGGKPPAPHDGKKFVCLDERYKIKPGNCVVFSFGVNNEWSFEDEFEKYGCKVYAYDPTMGKEDHQRSKNIKFFATGIANYKGTKMIGMGKNWNMRKVDRFENLVRDVGEEGRDIDYVKLDVELSEIDFLQDMIFNSPHVLTRVKQIAMEVHDGYHKKGQEFSQTSREQVFWPYFMLMRCAGFKLVHTRNAGAWREVVWLRDY